MSDLFAPTRTTPRLTLIPRDYQRKAYDESFRLWDSGERGVLDRIFTGGGKTVCACMKIRTWLDRGPNYYAMIVSYERDLVWQFAQEVDDFLGISPGIEMADHSVSPNEMPRVVVASRATLLPLPGATEGQLNKLAEYGILEVDWLSARVAKKMLNYLSRGRVIDMEAEFEARLARINGEGAIVMDGDVETESDRVAKVLAEINRLRDLPDARGGKTRLEKFDWRLNWLVIFDEAHRHIHRLKSVGHIVDWFDQNPASRRSGMTATPKRGDRISLGSKMFRGIAIDYPLFHLTRPCAVNQGWAVPYVQKYIEVEGVDFKSFRKIAGDFDEADLELVLGEEAVLAKLVQPLLDMAGDRRTLIFSPGVEMAKNVASFINARVQAECYSCGLRRWYPARLIGDGAECPCGRLIDPARITKSGEQARSINGNTPPRDRKAAYVAHQGGKFQFLSVCGLCREGYNDPDISCVAIFRPVSKKASSLAEQMKGRGCRPCRSIVPVLNELLSPEERVEAIANSEKPNCLIVDLVGVTGLADCASTVQIYADGLDDEVVNLAAHMLEQAEDEAYVAEIVQEAQDRVDAERDRIRAEQEEAERRRREHAEARAKADAQVRYSQHSVGSGSNVDPDRASAGQYRLMRLLGMNISATVSPRKAGRIITMLKERKPFEEVAYQNGLTTDQWETEGPTSKQLWRLGRLGIPEGTAVTGWDASQIIGASVDPAEFEERKMAEIRATATNDCLTGIGRDIALVKRVLPPEVFKRLIAAGRVKRVALVE
jgi:superfamily II DNA or RNA helicase